jgi:hypothetical protein
VNWKGVEVKLPGGINKVIIEGTRSSAGSSGMALDDIIIESCGVQRKSNYTNSHLFHELNTHVVMTR